MWRFISGVEPPKKEVKTEEDIKESKKEYEKEKRDRSFQVKWLGEFQWLRYDPARKIMYCIICKEHAVKKDKDVLPFVEGSDNFRRTTITRHAEGTLHQTCLLKEKANKMPSKTPAARCLLTINVNAVNKLKYLFRTAHAIAKHGRPYSDYEWQCDLDEAKGIDIGKTYRNRKEAAIFVESIAEVERRLQRKEIADANFVSLITDGATDSAVKETEILYIRHSKNGVVKTNFVGVKNVVKADANHITEAVLELLNTSFGDIWQNKLVGMATDGASVMLGKNGGVVAKVKQYLGQPDLIAIHCSAHRLELAYKEACKHAPLFTKIDSMLLSLYYFYHRSPLNRANLAEACKVTDQPPIVPTRVGGTRWVAHIKTAVSNVVTGYQPIVQHLQQASHSDLGCSHKISANKAKCLLKILTDRNKVHFLYFLLDVVSALSKVSEQFQNRQATIATIRQEIKAIKAVLIKFKESDGPMLRQVKEQISDGSMLHGLLLTGSKNLSTFEKSREVLLERLLVSLSNRFEGEEVIQASHIISPSTWPKDFEDFPDFGDEEVKLLITKCGELLKKNGYQTTEIEHEWTTIKSFLSTWKEKKPTWEEIHESYGDRFPNLLALINLLLAVPASSAEAERGFSLMKKTKSDWRSSLHDSHLSDLMMIQLESPEILDFDPTESIELWNENGVRSKRPFFKDSKISPAEDKDSEGEEETAWGDIGLQENE